MVYAARPYLPLRDAAKLRRVMQEGAMPIDQYIAREGTLRPVMEAALCKTIFALSKMDLMNVGCSSRRIWAVMEKHSAQTALSPFSRHSMLRFRRFAQIVYAMCSCLPETVQPSRPYLQLHTLRPYLQLRTTCRWVFQAMHAPMKIQVGALLVQLGALHEFQSQVLNRLTRMNLNLKLLADDQRQAVESVRKQYMHVRKCMMLITRMPSLI